jgi:hypothetical protein
MSRKWIVGALLLFVVSTVVQGLIATRHAAQDAVTQTALKQAVTAGRGALALSDKAIAVAKLAADSADMYRHRADSLKARGDSLELRVAALRGQFKQIAKTAPDTCAQVVEVASFLIDSLDVEVTTQRSRAAAADSASQKYRLALDTTQTALNKARLSLGELGKAAFEVEQASRPSIFARFIPHAGFGGAAGIDAHGLPNAVIGVTFGWTF